MLFVFVTGHISKICKIGKHSRSCERALKVYRYSHSTKNKNRQNTSKEKIYIPVQWLYTVLHSADDTRFSTCHKEAVGDAA